MIKKIIPIVVQSVFIFGGVAGGIYLKSSGMLGGAPATSAKSAESAHEEKGSGDGHEDASEKKGKSEGGHEEEGKEGKEGKDGKDGSSGVIRFSRQFVVPVIHRDGANSLLVLDIGIQAPPGSEGLYSYELKLRDALLAALLKFSNEGAFDDDFIETGNLDQLRAALLVAAKGVIGDRAQQILILSIARQAS